MTSIFWAMAQGKAQDANLCAGCYRSVDGFSGVIWPFLGDKEGYSRAEVDLVGHGYLVEESSNARSL